MIVILDAQRWRQSWDGVTHLCLSAWGKARTTLKSEVSLGNLARFCLRKIEVVESVTEGTIWCPLTSLSQKYPGSHWRAIVHVSDVKTNWWFCSGP